MLSQIVGLLKISGVKTPVLASNGTAEYAVLINQNYKTVAQFCSNKTKECKLMHLYAHFNVFYLFTTFFL